MGSLNPEHEVEYENRLAKLREGMRECGIDGLLLVQPTNVWYISGFWEFIPIRMQAVVVPADGDCTFMVSKNEYQYARQVSWIKDIRYYTEFPESGRPQNPWTLLGDVLCEKGLDRWVLGIEEECISLDERHQICNVMSGGSLCAAQHVAKRARMIKSDYEIKMLECAGSVAKAAWRGAWDSAAPGVREYELGVAARTAATKAAASRFSETADGHHSPITDGVQLVQAGARSAISHGRGSINPIREGDMVAMCFCMTNQFKGYRVGFSRNFVMGKATEEMMSVYSLLYEAQQEVIDRIRPGVVASDLDALVRKRIEDAGYGSFIEHRLGRGVGLDIAERPDLKEGDDTPLEVGMTLSIEPAVYIPGKWGIQIEDSVHVVQNGCRYLTEKAPKELPEVS